MLKKCGQCKIEKPFSEFYKSAKKKYGLRYECKLCHNANSKKREPLYNETRRLYRINNAEEYRESKKNYYNKNKETILKNNKNWRYTLKGKFSMYQAGARNRNIAWNLSFEQFEIFWQKPCTYCNSKIETIGIDRIESEKGYILDNCVPCCSMCNVIKGTLREEFFINHIQKIAKFYDNGKTNMGQTEIDFTS